MNRQQRRAQQRSQRAQPIYTPTTAAAHEQGYNEGWKAACDFCMKTCYAASTLALHDLEGYGTKRNTRFLRVMDGYVVDTLTSEEAIDKALENAGVMIAFREAIPEERITNR